MIRVVRILMVALFLVSPALAQETTEEMKKEIQALKQGQADIKKQLAEIKTLLQARPAARPAAPAAPNVKDVEFDLGSNTFKGDPSAPLTLIEMTDYQCPFCARYAKQTYPQIQKEYVETGKVRYVLVDMPLESIHRLAFKAAEATHCAGEQDKYWEMHDRLFDNQRALEPWSGHAEALGLDGDAFTTCLDSGKYADDIRADMKLAAKAGVRGTPGFLLAWTDPDDPTKVKGISSLRGAQPFTSFKVQIDKALAEGGE